MFGEQILSKEKKDKNLSMMSVVRKGTICCLCGDFDQLLRRKIAQEEGIPVEQVMLDHIRVELEKLELQKIPVRGKSPYLTTHSLADIELLSKKAEDCFRKEIDSTLSR